MSDLAVIELSERELRSEVTERLRIYLEDYLRWHRVEGHTQATITHYRRELTRFLDWFQGDEASLDRRGVLSHLAYMQDKGLAPKSLDTRFRDLRAWFRWLVLWELIPNDPTDGLNAPKVPQIRKPFVEVEQFQALIELCPLNTLLGSRRQAMLWLLLKSGLRRNEMFMLRLEDLDWKMDLLRVVHGKGQKDRHILFHLDAQRPMLHYLKARRLKGFDSEWLWVTEEGRRLTWHGIGQDLKRLQERAGVSIQDCCHAFRRTLAKDSVKAKVDRALIRNNFGWTSDQMIDHYTASMEVEAEAREAFKGVQSFA